MEIRTVDARDRIENIYREEGRRLWWALLAYSGDPEVAGDAAAEAFAQALGRGDKIHDPLAWIWRAAFRIAAGELQRRRVSDNRLPEIVDAREERASELIALLQRLPRNQRAAIAMHYYADRPIRDIAAALGVSPATARVHLHRGRRRLKQLMEEEDG